MLQNLQGKQSIFNILYNQSLKFKSTTMDRVLKTKRNVQKFKNAMALASLDVSRSFKDDSTNFYFIGQPQTEMNMSVFPILYHSTQKKQSAARLTCEENPHSDLHIGHSVGENKSFRVYKPHLTDRRSLTVRDARKYETLKTIQNVTQLTVTPVTSKFRVSGKKTLRLPKDSPPITILNQVELPYHISTPPPPRFRLSPKKHAAKQSIRSMNISKFESPKIDRPIRKVSICPWQTEFSGEE